MISGKRASSVDEPPSATKKSQPQKQQSFPEEGTNKRQQSLHIHRKEMPEQSNDYRVVMFGAAGVGKTSLVHRFINGTFKDHYTPTIEDTYRQVINNNKQVCTLHITDTTGSHQFPAMQRLSIEKGHAFILVFAVNSRSSIEELKNHYLEIKKLKADAPKLPMIMVGNKCDDPSRAIQTSLASEVAKKWGCEYIETSAKNNVNVNELFQTLLTLDSSRSITLEQVDDKKKKGGKKKNKEETKKSSSTKKDSGKEAGSSKKQKSTDSSASGGGGSGQKCSVM